MASKGNDEKHFQLMLTNLSNEFEKINTSLDMLKFALFDFVTVKTKLEDAKNSYDVFIELQNARHISPENLTKLIALFELVGLDVLKNIITRYGYSLPYVNARDVFSPFRISIVDIGSQLQRNKIEQIANVYKVPKAERSNQWKLLQYLYDHYELFNEENLNEFVETFGIKQAALPTSPYSKERPSTPKQTLLSKTATTQTSLKVEEGPTTSKKTDSFGDKNFRLMLHNLSAKLSQSNLNLDKIKLASADFITEKTKLKNASYVIQIIRELVDSGCITSKNLKKLIGILELLNFAHLRWLFQKFGFPYTNINLESIFRKFRIHIVGIGNCLEDENVHNISFVYNVPLKNSSNQWALLRYLEDESHLKEDNIAEFLQNFGINIDAVQWHPVVTIPVKGTQDVEVLLERKAKGQPSFDIAQSSPRCEDVSENQLLYLRCSTDTFGETEEQSLVLHKVTIIFNVNNNILLCDIKQRCIVFCLSSNDPTSLEKLQAMCWNGQILKDLAEVLVTEKYKQEFLDEWTVTPNTKQFKSAISKLKGIAVSKEFQEEMSVDKVAEEKTWPKPEELSKGIQDEMSVDKDVEEETQPKPEDFKDEISVDEDVEEKIQPKPEEVSKGFQEEMSAVDKDVEEKTQPKPKEVSKDIQEEMSVDKDVEEETQPKPEEQIQVQSSSEGSTERTLERKFRRFLFKISDEYPGVRYKWLRFLLYDHLPIQILQTDTIVGMLLFNTLSSQGDISCTNVIILSEIAELTNLMSAKKHIAEYKQLVQCEEGQVLTAYRKILFHALRQVAKDELPYLISFYNLEHFWPKFTDIWDLVLYLEIQKHLDNTEVKWQRFARLLNATAKNIMLEKSKAETLKEAVEAAKEAVEAAKEVEQEAAKLVAAAKVVVDKAVIEATAIGAGKTKLAKEKEKAVEQAELAAKNTEEKAASLKRQFTKLKDCTSCKINPRV